MNFFAKLLLLIIKFSLIILFFGENSVAQNKTMDSLLTLVKTANGDTSYVKNLIKISKLYTKDQDYNKAKTFVQQAIKKSELMNYQKGIISGYFCYANIYEAVSNYDSALYMGNKAVKLINLKKDQPLLASTYSQLGNLYFKKGDYNLALSYAIKALKIHEQVDNKIGMITSYNAMAIMAYLQKNEKRALENFLKAEKLAQEIDNKIFLGNIYNGIAAIYANKDNQKSLAYLFKSLTIDENLGNKAGVASILSNISEIYISEKKYTEAVKILNKSLDVSRELGDKRHIAYSLLGLGGVYQKLNNFQESEKCLKNALMISSSIRAKEIIKETNNILSELYEKNGDYKQALFYQKSYAIIKDTMYNAESSKQITEMNTKYESEKKDKELIKKDAEINMRQVQTEKQAVIKNGFIIGFVFLLGLIIFVYRGYVQKQKTNKLLNEKNQKITDSINYAKIIQSSILPSVDELKKYLPESFIFYQPKDIVSGDFYWLYPINDNTVVFAVVDCTGHGVPGALMSMLGYSLLEQIINQNKINKPAEILDQLNDLVIESLKQSGNNDTVKNGMDMVIFKLDYNNYNLEFAGAKNPLYIVRDQSLIELKGDRKSIGLSTGNANLFTNQQQQLQAGDHLYAFSDGYIDQKGGAENKKFYSANFQKLLISINSLNANEQHEQVKTTFANWKGTKEQMDDVLVFGTKV